MFVSRCVLKNPLVSSAFHHQEHQYDEHKYDQSRVCQLNVGSSEMRDMWFSNLMFPQKLLIVQPNLSERIAVSVWYSIKVIHNQAILQYKLDQPQIFHYDLFAFVSICPPIYLSEPWYPSIYPYCNNQKKHTKVYHVNTLPPRIMAENDPCCKANKSWGNPFATSNIMRGQNICNTSLFWNKSSPQKSKDHYIKTGVFNKNNILGREYQSSQIGDYDFHSRLDFQVLFRCLKTARHCQLDQPSDFFQPLHDPSFLSQFSWQFLAENNSKKTTNMNEDVFILFKIAIFHHFEPNLSRCKHHSFQFLTELPPKTGLFIYIYIYTFLSLYSLHFFLATNKKNGGWRWRWSRFEATKINKIPNGAGWPWFRPCPRSWCRPSLRLGLHPFSLPSGRAAHHHPTKPEVSAPG